VHVLLDLERLRVVDAVVVVDGLVDCRSATNNEWVLLILLLVVIRIFILI
jgi:hypothetical protein